MRIVTLNPSFIIYDSGLPCVDIHYDRYIFLDNDKTSIRELARRESDKCKEFIIDTLFGFKVYNTKEEIDKAINNNKLVMFIKIIETDTNWYAKLDEYHEKFNTREIGSLSREEHLDEFNYPFEYEYTYFINEDKLLVEKFFGFWIRNDNSYGFGPNYYDNYRLDLDKINKSIDDIDIGTIVSHKNTYTGKIVKELVIEKMILPWNEITIFSLDYEYLDKIKKDGLKDGEDLNFYIDHLGGIDSILGVDNESIQWLRDKGYLETEEG